MRRFIEEVLDLEDSAKIVIEKIRKYNDEQYTPVNIADFLCEEYYLLREQEYFDMVVEIVKRILQKNDPDSLLGWNVKINNLL